MTENKFSAVIVDLKFEMARLRRVLTALQKAPPPFADRCKMAEFLKKLDNEVFTTYQYGGTLKRQVARKKAEAALAAKG